MATTEEYEVNIPRESTMLKIAGFCETIAAKAALDMAGGSDGLTYQQVHELVHSGYAEDIFEIGTTQFLLAYTYNGTEYEWPFDVVHFDDFELEDGETVHGMVLQAHYASPQSVMFNNSMPLIICDEAFAAGTYNFSCGFNWGSKDWVSGATFNFTLENDVPAGGLIYGLFSAADYTYDNWTIVTYSSYDDVLAGNPIETVSVSEGEADDATDLGAINSTAGDIFESGHEALYGKNTWDRSAYRQWLNSDADAGEWWEAQNDNELPPDQLSTYAGFLQGFDSDFLDILGEVKMSTMLNTLTEDGSTVDTYDKFFLPSLEQIYCEPQVSGEEGDYWEYWKRVAGATEPQATGTSNIYKERINYALNAKTSAVYVRLRSAYRSNGSYVWNVHSAGCVSAHGARVASRCCPACVII